MTSWSLRSQLLALGLLAAVVPLLVLLFVVFQVEETETIDPNGGPVVEVVAEAGVSPWVPATAVLLSAAAAGVVWFWAKRAVDPIEQMTRLTDEVQAGSLDRRLQLQSAPVEIRALGESFDRMLDRLAAASTLERRLIEDASHELRTPLAALAARLEIATRRAVPGDVVDDLDACNREVDRLQATLDSLLASARSRQTEIEQVDNDVVAIVTRVVDHRRLLSPDVPIEMRAPGHAHVGVDGSSVERAIANLVTNAVEHGGGAPVRVEVLDLDDAVEIMVTDDGSGIPEDQLPSVFDRYTGDRHGIGLAIVKQIADAYGSVDVESPVDGRSGTRFTLRLRRAAER